MATVLKLAFSRATITASRISATSSISIAHRHSAFYSHKTVAFAVATSQGYQSEQSLYRGYSTKTKDQRNKDKHESTDNTHTKGKHSSKKSSPTASSETEYKGDPNLYRIFFRSPDKIYNLEQAQVFINYIKSSYGPLTQYQFIRCPETKKYFGYGFLTFRDKESLDKALKDVYIRVGKMDFELVRSDNNSRNRKPIKHKRIGFAGFHNLEELRSKKRQEEEKSNSIAAQASIEGGKTKEQPIQEQQNHNDGNTFVSALPSSSRTESATTTTDKAAAKPSPSAKPYYVPLQKKGLSQLWKTIPAEIERSEQQSTKQENEPEHQSSPNIDSKKIASELVKDILETKP
ncbi:hypothetical protein FBU30_006283 [Linnemannia zychae]|nr:hypothetical protein FBU30_006283 [Linnemannia zychae]